MDSRWVESHLASSLLNSMTELGLFTVLLLPFGPYLMELHGTSYLQSMRATRLYKAFLRGFRDIHQQLTWQVRDRSMND